MLSSCNLMEKKRKGKKKKLSWQFLPIPPRMAHKADLLLPCHLFIVPENAGVEDRPGTLRYKQ